MSPHWLRSLILGATMSLACSNPTEPTGEARLSIDVAALTLVDVSDVCYTLAITNEAGDPVWSASDLCASRYGAGGAISYVAPCDATDTDGDGEATQTITLTLDAVFGPGGATDPLADYIDPCAAPHAPGGCRRTAACVANADTPVRFDLTLMREAHQGFFDLVVQLDDIFCSAKVDCVDTAGAGLRLLHHPATGVRGQTVVVGLACTSGPGGAPTALLRDPITITCDDTTTTLDPALGLGNAWGVGPDATPDPDPDDAVWQYAVHAGDEALLCDDRPCDKRYWNVLVGLDPTVAGCTLTTTATAIDASLAGSSTPQGNHYPLVVYDVPLTTDDDEPALACGRHPLDGETAGVAIGFSGIGVSRAFATRFDGAGLRHADDTPEPVTDGLVLHFDAADPASYPGSGALWADLTDNGLDGALVGGVGYSPANQGVLVFDGVDDRVVVASDPLLQTNTITIELLVVFDALPSGVYRDIVELGLGTGQAQLYFRQNADDTLSWEWYPVAAIGTAVRYPLASLVTGRAYHFALTGDAMGGATMYIDGQLAATTSGTVPSGVTAWASSPLMIGGSTWDGFSQVRIAALRIYDRVLDAAEIVQGFEALDGRFP